MTIEKDLKPLMDLAKESKESEREIFRLTSGYELRFHEVDINRVVSKEVTGSVIWNIDRWLKSYKENILPNLSYINEDSPKNKALKTYIDNLKWMRESLIPENTSSVGMESTVRRNYSFLKPNKVLTYNQALFTLLGLNAITLDNDHYLVRLQTLNGINPVYQSEYHLILEGILWGTPQNFELKSCAYFSNGVITSEDLIKFATEDNDFFSDNWRKNKFFEYTKDVVSERPENTRQLTEDKKILVNELDIECKSKYKNWSKEARASWIAQQMKERPEIDSKLELTEENIYRNYLKSNKQ
jgi:hypothetical protein